MSAASIAAMYVCIEEDKRRRDPDYRPLCSVGDLMDVPWAMPLLLIIELVWAAAMIYMVYK